MIVFMSESAADADLLRVSHKARTLGLTPREVTDGSRRAVIVTGEGAAVDPEEFARLPGVASCDAAPRACLLAAREAREKPTVVTVRGASIGAGPCALIAGPCAVESADQLQRTAERVARAGIRFFRGGAFKPRSSPYSFQGLREEGLRLLENVRRQFDLRIVTEARDERTLPAVLEAADIVQIGARNMQNFSLLEAVGDARRPVLLKRGGGATLTELFLAAEYILARGNPQVILCERGIRTFESSTRNTLDLSAVPVARRHTHLPIVVDPSHAAGVAWAVPALARAAVASGADGVMIEVHPDPSHALSDGPQALAFDAFDALAAELRDLSAWMASRRPIW